MAEVENLFLGHLRHIRGPLDQIENDIRVIKSDPGRLESDLAKIYVPEQSLPP